MMIEDQPSNHSVLWDLLCESNPCEHPDKHPPEPFYSGACDTCKCPRCFRNALYINGRYQGPNPWKPKWWPKGFR
jgi:hypothetical protein